MCAGGYFEESSFQEPVDRLWTSAWKQWLWLWRRHSEHTGRLGRNRSCGLALRDLYASIALYPMRLQKTTVEAIANGGAGGQAAKSEK